MTTNACWSRSSLPKASKSNGTPSSNRSRRMNGACAPCWKDGERHACSSAYLCGCDGARSRVRESLRLDFSGGTYQHLYYVADVQTEGPPNHDLVGHLAANTFALMLPVRSRGMQRLIGILPDDAPPEPDFDTVRPILEPLFGIRVEQVNWFSTYRVHHRVAAHFRVGRCFLSGDAAHIHSPAGGQGMNTGIGDAINLAWKLAHVLQGRADAGAARHLRGRAHRVRAQAGGHHRPRLPADRLARHRRTAAAPLAAAACGAGAERLRGRAPHVVQDRVASADPLSRQPAQRRPRRRGNRRRPAAWLPSDNFTALQSLDWQLHVYGRVDPVLAAAAKPCTCRCTPGRGAKPPPTPACWKMRPTWSAPICTWRWPCPGRRPTCCRSWRPLHITIRQG
jgi:2-polyprenyl-6-methoxyphenol hydroxylase-like FAD-dependent oxidoreductase